LTAKPVGFVVDGLVELHRFQLDGAQDWFDLGGARDIERAFMIKAVDIVTQ
jgi:hypothetical protein